nr:MAG TPA: hypothetical protein [Caudoviricetes sp.]
MKQNKKLKHKRDSIYRIFRFLKIAKEIFYGREIKWENKSIF